MNARGSGRNFVLVHGAWCGGWCWRGIADRLIARGHRVYAPTLTGLADRAHLLSRDITLDTHIADVANLILWEDLDHVVLVGHSLGGWAISGVAEVCEERIAAIVYLDAHFPDDGQRLIDVQTPAEREEATAAWARGDVARPLPPMDRFAMHDPAAAAAFGAKMTPQPLGVSFTPIRLTGARERIARKAYIRGVEADRPLYDAYLARLRRDPSWRIYELPCGHIVQSDMPDRLTEILIEMA